MKNHTVSLNLEVLENRDLMATGVTAVMSGGVLTINGTAQADKIYVMQDNNRITIADQYTNQLVRIGSTTSVSVASLSKIAINGGAGDDVICLNTGGHGIVTVAAEIHGGAGNDTLYGGAGKNYLDGGAGNDTFLASTGNGIFNTYHEDTYNVVIHGCQPTDIHQVTSPTCQTLASLAEAASQGSDFSNNIRKGSGNTYIVNLPGAGTQNVYFDGTWTDNDPTPQADGGVREIWPLLMQRARLQSLNVSWSGLKTQADWDADQTRTGGRLYNVADALKTFTNRSVSQSALSQATPQSLQSALSRGDDVVLGSLPGAKKKDLTSDGIAHNHAYAVLRVYQQSGRWLADLYNPWGTDANNGQRIGPPGSRGTQADEGIITLDWATVQRNFVTVDIAKR